MFLFYYCAFVMCEFSLFVAIISFNTVLEPDTTKFALSAVAAFLKHSSYPVGFASISIVPCSFVHPLNVPPHICYT